jgi:sigma-E factor negative regulatory protein RseB
VRRRVPVAGAVGAVVVVLAVAGPLTVLALLGPQDSQQKASPGSGHGPAGSDPHPVVQEEARRLLARAAAAPSVTPYHGVQFVSAWTSGGATSEIVDVDHVPGKGTSVRSDGTVVAPARHLTLLAVGVPSIADGGVVGLLAAHYSLRVVGQDTVAGRAVDVIAARRPGARASAHDTARFWLDRASGLVLRREVYDEGGRTTRASAFVSVSVGQGDVSPDAPQRPWSATMDTATLARLCVQGWHCPSTLPGPLTLVDARRGGRGDEDIVHLSYSDGIATVSVFEQRGRLDEKGLDGDQRATEGGQAVFVHGQVPRRVVWSSGGVVYTVVADAPERTVDDVVAALPHRGAADGTLGRLGRGLDRVASWFNPFG